MNVIIYRGFVRNERDGREVMQTKLVCEWQRIWHGPGDEECYVNFVAYSVDDFNVVNFKVWRGAKLHLEGAASIPQKELFNAVMSGDEALSRVLYRYIDVQVSDIPF